MNWDGSYSHFFTSGYFLFGNGMVLLSIAFIIYTFADDPKKKLKLWSYFLACVSASMSRVALAFALLTRSQLILGLSTLFTFGYTMLFFEYARECLDETKYSIKPLKFHIPLATLCALIFIFCDYGSPVKYVLVALASGLAFLLGYRLCSKVLPENLRLYPKLCYIFALLITVSQFAARLQMNFKWSTLEPVSASEAFPLLFASEIAFAFFVSICVSLANKNYSKNRKAKVVDYQGIVNPILSFVLVLMIVIIGSVIGLRFEKEILQKGQNQLDQQLADITFTTNRFIDVTLRLADTLSAVPAVKRLLSGQDAAYGELGKFLEDFNRINPEYMGMVIGIDGLILASSRDSDLLIGKDVVFRNYLAQARKGLKSFEITNGAYTGRLGFFACCPVFAEDKTVVGLVVIKCESEDFVKSLKNHPHAFITDEDGRILLSNDNTLLNGIIKPFSNGFSIITHSENGVNSEKFYYFDKYLFGTLKLSETDWKAALITPAGRSTHSDQVVLMLLIILIVAIVLLILNTASLQNHIRENYEEAQEQFRAIFYNAPESILIISAVDLEILEANNGTAAQFGFSDGVVGRNYRDLLPEDNPGISESSFSAETKCFKHQRSFVRADGKTFTADVIGAPIMFADKKAIIILLRDISGLKKAGLELMKARDLAESANAAKSRFFANASHEIRTPMNAIIGLTEFAYDMSENDDQRRLLSLMRSSSKSLLKLVNDILDLSKIESGKLEINREPTYIRRLGTETVLMIKGGLGSKQLDVIFEASDSLPEIITVDAGKLRQIITNLLGNAAKNTEKGFIKLCMGISQVNGSIVLECRIEDSGHGIPPELRESIFMPFVHGDYIGSGSKGTGLGLSICQQLIDLLGGSIRLDSTSAKGSVFSFRIPVGIPHSTDLPESEDDEADKALFKAIDETILNEQMKNYLLVKADGTPVNILVADDNEVNLFLAGSLIEKFKGFFSYAYNGREVLSLYENVVFDLALIDVQMPVIDGITAIKEIRKREQKTGIHVPIIAVSAFNSEDERRVALEAGADSYLTKPYFPKDMLLMMKQTMEAAASAAEEKAETAEKPSEKKLKQIDEADLKLRILDKIENLIKIAEIYSRRSSELKQQLLNVGSSKDSSALRETAHSVKGVVGMLGAKKTFELSLKIEKLAEEGSFEEAYRLVPKLIADMKDISDDLKVLLS